MPRPATYDKADLILRARDLFWTKGWAGTSMKDLEKGLDMRPGSFYAAFGSKEALYGLALDHYAQESQARVKALAKELGPLGALQALPAAAISGDTALPQACMLAKTLLELSATQGPLGAKAQTYLDEAEQEFQTLFAQAQRAGQIAGHHDPSALARRYQSDLTGLRFMAVRSGVDANALAQDIARGLAALA